ncbi:hypothetical protein ABK040_002713 [Willaertia magna]
MQFIDIGVNLTDDMYKGIYNNKNYHPSDIENILERSKNGNLKKLILTSTCYSDIYENINLIRKFQEKFPNFLYTTIGIHPTRCNEFNEENENLLKNEFLKIINENRDIIVAIGEIGLDYDRLHFCNKEQQLKYFEFQLELSKISKLPLFLHNRNSTEDLFNILNKHFNELPKMVIHSFDGSSNDLKLLLSLDNNNLLNKEMKVYIGINGCSLKTIENLNVIKNDLDINRICIETDSPWCEIKSTHASYSYLFNDIDNNNTILNVDNNIDNNCSCSSKYEKNNSMVSNTNKEINNNTNDKEINVTTQQNVTKKQQQQSNNKKVNVKKGNNNSKKNKEEENNLWKRKDKFEFGKYVKGRNEPDQIYKVLKVITKLKYLNNVINWKEKEEEIAKQIYENTLSVYFPNELL